MERNCSFQQLRVANAVMTLETLKFKIKFPCNNDIPMSQKLSRAYDRQRRRLTLYLDTEAEMILERSSVFSFPSNISDIDISSTHHFSLGIGWRKGLVCCRILAQLSKHG